MSAKTYHEVKELLCHELDEIARKKEMSPAILDMTDKLTHSIKSIDTILAMEDTYGESGYYPTHGYDRSGKRDSRGRYSRDGAKDDMVRELREIMHDTHDDAMRRKLHTFIEEIETA